MGFRKLADSMVYGDFENIYDDFYFCQNLHLLRITVSKKCKQTNKQKITKNKKINKSFSKQHMRLLLSLSLINIMFLNRLFVFCAYIKVHSLFMLNAKMFRQWYQY